MKRTSLSLIAVLVIVGCLSNEQRTATQQPAPQSQSASQGEPVPDKPRTVVIPAGSVITVRLVNPLDPGSKYWGCLRRLSNWTHRSWRGGRSTVGCCGARPGNWGEAQ
jgi:hypothetical protein